MPRAVIFDMDGVLVDSMHIHWLAWQHAFKAYNITITRENFAKTPGMTFRPVVSLLGGDNFTEAEMEDIGNRQRDEAERLLKENYPVLPGAPELIKSLDLAGWQMAIATSGPLVNLRLAVEKIPEAKRIKSFITLEDVTHGKPDPEVFLKAAERLGVTPKESIVIEDSKVGLEAAKRGGFIAVALTTTFPSEELEPMADLVVDSLDKLSPKILDLLFS